MAGDLLLVVFLVHRRKTAKSCTGSLLFGLESGSRPRNAPRIDMSILVTGAAGFIGFHTARRLLAEGHPVVGLDNLNDYYDVKLKEARLALLAAHPAFRFERADLADRRAMEAVFLRHAPQTVIHLAAQAGVRYSIENPHVYAESNLTGFLHVLEGCRQARTAHLVYASSSSVYGTNSKQPFSVTDQVDQPISLYAATKRANELMAHVYSHLFAVPATGLRFFTVYGPWGRPDMAPFLFARAILSGQPIQVFNHGRMKRDFTYVDDIVDGLLLVSRRPPVGSPPYKLYNIGSHQPVDLLRFIAVLEECLARKAEKVLLPMQPGDVPETFADVDDLTRDTGFAPATPIEVGIARFAEWYRSYYGSPLSVKSPCESGPASRSLP
jgi:UDP-glucuronate 4-epimerase